jgi:DNA repair protein RadC
MSGAITVSVSSVQAIINFLFSRNSASLMLKSNAPDVSISPCH